MIKIWPKLVSFLMFGLILVSARSSVYSQTVQPVTFPAVSSAIMDATITFRTGKRFTLADYHGKVILVNLWAIWSNPGRPRIPVLKALHRKYRSKGFEVIGLNVGDIDGKPERIRNIKKYARLHNIHYRLVSSSSALAKEIYELTKFDAIPLSLLIDREGRLRAIIRGGGPSADEQLKKSVASLMAETTVD